MIAPPHHSVWGDAKARVNAGIALSNAQCLIGNPPFKAVNLRWLDNDARAASVRLVF
jgi:hypothetical protein